MRRILISSAIIVLAFRFLISCNVSNKEVAIYQQLDSTLVKSIITIQGSTLARIRSLENKAADPVTSEKGKLWYSKSQVVSKMIDDVFKLVESLKGKSSNYNKDSKNIYSSLDMEIVNQQLATLRKRLLEIDPELTSNLGALIPTITDSSNIDLRNGSTLEVRTILSKTQANLKISENMFIEYCDRKVSNQDDGYDVFQALIYGNSNIYHPGELASISAGIGAFSSKAVPNITTNGKKFKRTPLGDFTYTFQVTKKLGKHELPISINYVDPNTGIPVSIKKIIRYTVEAKCE